MWCFFLGPTPKSHLTTYHVDSPPKAPTTSPRNPNTEARAGPHVRDGERVRDSTEALLNVTLCTIDVRAPLVYFCRRHLDFIPLFFIFIILFSSLSFFYFIFWFRHVEQQRRRQVGRCQPVVLIYIYKAEKKIWGGWWWGPWLSDTCRPYINRTARNEIGRKHHSLVMSLLKRCWFD